MGPMVEDDCVPEEWLVVKMSRLGSPGRLALVVSELTVQVIVRTLVCKYAVFTRRCGGSRRQRLTPILLPRKVLLTR
jgi:hypothetical protein